MAKAGPETQLVKKMREAGRKKYGDRLVTIKYHGSAFSESGVSDLLCCLDGIFVACEVKAPESYGGSVEKALAEGPTLKQRAFLSRISEAGGVWSVAATVEQFLETLEAAEHQAANGRKVTPICTCVGEVCDYVADPVEGCLYCREADPTEPCPNIEGSVTA